jgi:N-acetylglucosaminyl-diphospho-decaprenol L-rhamnosyltransferase
MSERPRAAGAGPRQPRWAAVVVNFEAGDLLTDCVQSLLADASAGPPEVVVVDNGSRDGSVERLRASVPEVRIVVPERNRGYASAANVGAAATSAPVVAVCNCDLRVEAGTAGALLARFDQEDDLGALGPRVRNPDGTHYPSARSIPRVGDAVGHGLLGLFHPRNRFTRRYRELDADPSRPRDVGFVSGAAIWLRRAALDAVGGWDDGFFMYVEDVDLCWRLRRAGWRVAYEPGGEVVHVQGASTAHRPYRMLFEHHRSLLRFAAKRWRGWRRVLLAPAAAYLAVRFALAALARALGRRPPRSVVSTPTG